MDRLTVPLAASLGDPAGVGPELLATAWAAREVNRLPTFFVTGGHDLLLAAARQRGLEVRVERITDPGEADAVFRFGLPVLGDLDGDYHPGEPDRTGAALALASLQAATALAVGGAASAVVTGPIAKSRLAEVGFVHPGQTEFVAAACRVAAEDAVMMLVGPSLRTVPLTVHVALAAVPHLVTVDLIQRRARIVAAALRRDFGIPAPRIAVTALNPHAGEDGRFGDEDRRVVAPAVAALRAEGIDASGPHAADALFAPHNRGNFDAALCMYHDQALIPIKALDFDAGVNVTLGLPIVRTSADHGTAFAIAGQARAHPGATIAALRLAGECAARRAGMTALPPLREVIARHGLSASKALGQNFLFDEQLLARIAAIPGNLRDRPVLEVGPGPGGLTRALLRGGARVTAVEMDRRCLPALAELGEAFPGQLTVIEGDALKIDPATLFDEPYAIVANLPYNVGTALFTGWLSGEAWPPAWSSLTLMFQQEVAQRIVAPADSDAFGRLAVLAQWRSVAKIAMKVHRSAFTPPPKVMSAIVHVVPGEAPSGVSMRTLARVTEAAFGQRRKMLRQSLKAVPGGIDALAQLGIDPARRAETLTVDDFVAIARILTRP